ncbi:hypothetical protein MMC18_006769 [Xylographa bjoerkii]|nr:hypothetical protein [Xylographa bjoerkii]
MLKQQKVAHKATARGISYRAERDLEALKDERQAINEELTLLGCAGYDSWGSDIESEDEEED